MSHIPRSVAVLQDMIITFREFMSRNRRAFGHSRSSVAPDQRRRHATVREVLGPCAGRILPGPRNTRRVDIFNPYVTRRCCRPSQAFPRRNNRPAHEGGRSTWFSFVTSVAWPEAHDLDGDTLRYILQWPRRITRHGVYVATGMQGEEREIYQSERRRVRDRGGSRVRIFSSGPRRLCRGGRAINA